MSTLGARSLVIASLALCGCAPPPAPPAPLHEHWQPADRSALVPPATVGAPPPGPERVEHISFQNQRGGTIRASVVRYEAGPEQRHPGVILQRDVRGGEDDLMAEAQSLARAGAVALLPGWALDGAGFPSDDGELWTAATNDVRRAFDVLAARADVDPRRLAFVGVGFGASVGAIVAATDSRVRSFALVEPEGDFRAGSYSSLRFGPWHVERLVALPPGERLRQAKQHPPVLVQFGARERALSDEDLAMWTNAMGAADQVRWYATSRGRDAREARFSFLASGVGLGGPRALPAE